MKSKYYRKNYFFQNDRNSIAVVIVVLIILAMIFFSSCSYERQLTEEQRVEKLDEFCQLWLQYKADCYNDSVEVCETWIDLYSLEEDSTCYWNHVIPTIDGFYDYLLNVYYIPDNY